MALVGTSDAAFVMAEQCRGMAQAVVDWLHDYQVKAEATGGPIRRALNMDAATALSQALSHAQALQTLAGTLVTACGG